MPQLNHNFDSDASAATNQGEFTRGSPTVRAVNAGRPELPPAQAARVVAGMRRLRDERYPSNAALGKALGMSGSAVGQILGVGAKNRPSLTTAARVADLLGYADVAALLAGASPPDVVDQYPERARALERLRGLLPPEVEAQVRSAIVHDDRRLTELDWVRLAALQAREHADLALLPPRTIAPRRT